MLLGGHGKGRGLSGYNGFVLAAFNENEILEIGSLPMSLAKDNRQSRMLNVNITVVSRKDN